MAWATELCLQLSRVMKDVFSRHEADVDWQGTRCSEAKRAFDGTTSSGVTATKTVERNLAP